MFKRLWQNAADGVEIRFEERVIRAQAGDTVAAALLAAGESGFRETVFDGQRRGPYCMIGNCFECRVEIDGQPNQQACLRRVHDGMRIRRQRGARASEIADES